MGYSEMNCPHCGAVNREHCNIWMYDSPIKACKKCEKKYVDKRFKELAIEQENGLSVSIKNNVKLALIFMIFLMGAVILLLYQHFMGYKYSLEGIFIVIISILAVLGCTIQIIRIKSGIQNKVNEKYRQESEIRLKNYNYAHELASMGYDVPDKYLWPEVPDIIEK